MPRPGHPRPTPSGADGTGWEFAGIDDLSLRARHVRPSNCGRRMARTSCSHGVLAGARCWLRRRRINRDIRTRNLEGFSPSRWGGDTDAITATTTRFGCAIDPASYGARAQAAVLRQRRSTSGATTRVRRLVPGHPAWGVLACRAARGVANCVSESSARTTAYVDVGVSSLVRSHDLARGSRRGVAGNVKRRCFLLHMEGRQRASELCVKEKVRCNSQLRSTAGVDPKNKKCDWTSDGPTWVAKRTASRRVLRDARDALPRHERKRRSHRAARRRQLRTRNCGQANCGACRAGGNHDRTSIRGDERCVRPSQEYITSIRFARFQRYGRAGDARTAEVHADTQMAAEDDPRYGEVARRERMARAHLWHDAPTDTFRMATSWRCGRAVFEAPSSFEGRRLRGRSYRRLRPPRADTRPRRAGTLVALSLTVDDLRRASEYRWLRRFVHAGAEHGPHAIKGCLEL